MSALLAFLPDEALPVVLVFGAIAVMFGLISARGLLGFVFAFVFLGVVVEALWPVVAELFRSLSVWWPMLIMVVIAVAILRMLLGLLFGRSVSNHVVSMIVYDVFFRIPARILGGLLGLVFALSHITHDRR